MNEFVVSFFQNEAIIIPLIAWFIAQTIKVIIVSFRKKKFTFSSYLIPGGFPSSHTASVTALATVIGMEAGIDSMIFAVALALAVFIVYDASVLRRASQRQARSLNRLIDAMSMEEEMEPLRDVLGHTWLEVFVGGIIGIGLAFLMLL